MYKGSVLTPCYLLTIVYINDIYRSINLGKSIWFADDTNIFVVDKCKTTVYKTANSVLNLIYIYMKCNFPHIKATGGSEGQKHVGLFFEGLIKQSEIQKKGTKKYYS